MDGAGAWVTIPRLADKRERLPAPRRDHGLCNRGTSVEGPSQQRGFCSDVAKCVDLIVLPPSSLLPGLPTGPEGRGTH